MVMLVRVFVYVFMGMYVLVFVFTFHDLTLSSCGYLLDRSTMSFR